MKYIRFLWFFIFFGGLLGSTECRFAKPRPRPAYPYADSTYYYWATMEDERILDSFSNAFRMHCGHSKMDAEAKAKAVYNRFSSAQPPLDAFTPDTISLENGVWVLIDHPPAGFDGCSVRIKISDIDCSVLYFFCE